MSEPFKLKYNNSAFPFKSPLKDKTPLGPSDGDNSKILKKYGWSGKTREEVKATIRFNTSNQLEKEKKRAFYKIYGTANR
tara:strand:- start:279 stop:518 length:240 start_codon:yes stop_codon:yes gene_type:complete